MPTPPPTSQAVIQPVIEEPNADADDADDEDESAESEESRNSNGKEDEESVTSKRATEEYETYKQTSRAGWVLSALFCCITPGFNFLFLRCFRTTIYRPTDSREGGETLEMEILT